MASSIGVLCGAGFETPAEALFLGKKLMVVPMKNQYEQQCNAAALEKMKVPVLKKLKLSKVKKIKSWVSGGEVIPVSYSDITAQVLDELFDNYKTTIEKYAEEPGVVPHSFKKLRNNLIGKFLKNAIE